MCKLISTTLSFCIVMGIAALAPCKALAVPCVITFQDSPGEGFFDPALGAARQAAFQVAVAFWATKLSGTVPIEIDAEFNSLGGSATAATLGRAGATSVHANDPGLQTNTWFPDALADQLAGTDLAAGFSDIGAEFNSDVDGSVVLGTKSFYYGTDALPTGGDVDFITVALHELGHGFGFFSEVTSNGTFRGFPPNGFYPAIYDRQLAVGSGVFAPSTDFATISDAARLIAVTGGDLWWKGTNVRAAHSGFYVKMYAPNPWEDGSSIAHWDTSNTPDLLMEPFDTGAHHDLDLTLPAFKDMGWTLAPGVGPASTRHWDLYR